MSEHPSSLALEGFAVGEKSEVVDAHLATCAACTRFVHEISVQTTTFRPDLSAPSRRGWIAGSIALPLAAAASLLVATRSPSVPPPVASAPMPMPMPVPTRTAAVTFKGDILVAIIRERGDKQERFTGPVHVQPGDRLRVEIGLDHEQSVAGGLLGDDGGFVELVTGATRTMGTYFSERSARVDATPGNGVIVIGTPENVARARDARRFDGVKVVRVIWERP